MGFDYKLAIVFVRSRCLPLSLITLLHFDIAIPFYLLLSRYLCCFNGFLILKFNFCLAGYEIYYPTEEVYF